MPNITAVYPLYDNVTFTITGWRNGDPARFTPEIGVTIDDWTWARLQEFYAAGIFGLSPAGGSQIYVSGFIQSASPFTGGNNNMSIQVRTATRNYPTGEGFFFASILAHNNNAPAGLFGVIPADVASQTMHFRFANNNDDILGLYTPRMLSGLSFALYVELSYPDGAVPVGAANSFTRVPIGVGALPIIPTVSIRRGRSFVQVIS